MCAHERLEDKRTVLDRTFAGRLGDGRGSGCENPETSLVLKVLKDLNAENPKLAVSLEESANAKAQAHGRESAGQVAPAEDVAKRLSASKKNGGPRAMKTRTMYSLFHYAERPIAKNLPESEIFRRKGLTQF